MQRVDKPPNVEPDGAATFAPRSSLRSRPTCCTFHVTDSTPAEASVVFAAGVRLATGTAVELLTEADAPASGALAIVAGPEGTIPGLAIRGANASSRGGGEAAFELAP